MTNLIQKRDGRMVKFQPKLIYRSLIRSGASKKIAEKITNEVSMEIGVLKTTENIYKKAYETLNREHKPTSMKYSIKKSIFKFGPTGFVFEKFVAVIFKRLGYNVETNVHIKGCCATLFKVDVFADVKKKRIAMEIKFHNRMSIKGSDIKTALYVWARSFQDLQFKNKVNFLKKRSVDDGILVTKHIYNHAIEYADCIAKKI